jgi:peptidoglycan/LPS O-acetylase OafA/YrhL
MGIYRLVLAWLVAIGHMHQPIAETYAVGVSAVISFFLLSGFVMTGLIHKYYFQTDAILAFYFERFTRLSPQFYFYSALTLLLALIGFRHDFMLELPSAQSLLLQFAGIPLNFYRNFPNMLVPQGWSLGLEIIFYLIFPVILIFNLRLWLGALSVIVYLYAYFGVIDTDLWGYRYLPGVLFIFLVGSFLFTDASRYERGFVALAYVFALILFGLSYYEPGLGSLYNRSVLLGLIIGIPAVKLLKPFSHEASGKTYDGLAGNLSYGVFLGHMIIIGALQTFGGIDFKNQSLWQDILCTTSALALSTLLSYISFKLVEEPLISFRRRSRKKQLTTFTRDAVGMRSRAN